MLVVDAVDTLALALAESALAIAHLAIAFASIAFAIAFASIAFALALWLNPFSSAFAGALGCAVTFALASRANLGTGPLGHSRRRKAKTLRMSLAMAAVALHRRARPCILTISLAFAKCI